MSKDLLLNDILRLSDDDIKNSKIELNATEGKGGDSYIDKWISISEDKKYSGITGCSYFIRYSSKQKNFNIGNIVFSFLKIYKKSNEWLFISAAEINDILDTDKTNTIEGKNLTIIEKFRPLFGRLIIKHKKDSSFGRYTFNMKDRIDACFVKEILSCQYNGEQFEGYDRVYLPYGKLKDVLQGKIMPTYCEALKKITGIYCLTDTKNGKLYIGSATGEGGVAQRWGNYLDSKDGGNKKLIELHKEKGDEYFKDNFTYTLIEYFGLFYDQKKIKEREQYWKKCFDTINNGYNCN